MASVVPAELAFVNGDGLSDETVHHYSLEYCQHLLSELHYAVVAAEESLTLAFVKADDKALLPVCRYFPL